MYVHHDWNTMVSRARSAFPQIAGHVLLPRATGIEQAAIKARERLENGVLQRIFADVPDQFLVTEGNGEFIDPAARRDAYVHFFAERLQHSAIFEGEAIRAHERQL